MINANSTITNTIEENFMLLATATSLEGLEKLINRRYYSTGYSIQGNKIYNPNFTKEKLDNINSYMRIENKKGRYKLYDNQ